MAYKILFVDDESYLLVALRAYFEPRGFLVEEATTGAAAISKVKDSPDDYVVAVVDYQLGDMNGAQVVEALRDINPDLNLLMFSGKGNDPTILKSAMKVGPLEFIDKHGEDFTELEAIIRKMCVKYERTTKPAGLDSPSENERRIQTIPGLYGRSKALLNVVELIEKYRSLRKTILILGETGTGKRIIAEALHLGARDKYFKINCADYAGKPELLRSELFGHVKGAFTGALYEKRGLLEAASGGTFVLDEVHLLGMEGQAQLLTAIEEKLIRRVGGTKDIPVDVKIIAIAKPDLKQMVEAGQFKRDLYHRLKVKTIHIPPLRERIEDIEPIVSLICRKYAKETGIKRSFQKKAIEPLQHYSWPGNVRELENYVGELLDTCNGRQVTPSQLSSKFFIEEEPETLPTYGDMAKKCDELMKGYFDKALRRFDFNKDRVAREIGISATGLRRQIGRLKIPALSREQTPSNHEGENS